MQRSTITAELKFSNLFVFEKRLPGADASQRTLRSDVGASLKLRNSFDGLGSVVRRRNRRQ